jgi:hypothetical protein
MLIVAQFSLLHCSPYCLSVDFRYFSVPSSVGSGLFGAEDVDYVSQYNYETLQIAGVRACVTFVADVKPEDRSLMSIDDSPCWFFALP